jgi:hypothetical protein
MIRHLVTAITGGGWVLCEVDALSHGTKGQSMRKLEIIGLAGIVAATAFGVWSADTVAPRVAKADVVAASAPIAPHAITEKLGRALPSEYWSHPY